MKIRPFIFIILVGILLITSCAAFDREVSTPFVSSTVAASPTPGITPLPTTTSIPSTSGCEYLCYSLLFDSPHLHSNDLFDKFL